MWKYLFRNAVENQLKNQMNGILNLNMTDSEQAFADEITRDKGIANVWSKSWIIQIEFQAHRIFLKFEFTETLLIDG